MQRYKVYSKPPNNRLFFLYPNLRHRLVIHPIFVSLSDDVGQLLGSEVVSNPGSDGLRGPVLNAHSASHVLNQMVADEQPEYFSSFFTTHAILPHIGILELVKE